MEWNWVAPALGSPLIYAVVSIGDKLILSRTTISLASFNFHVGLSQLAIASVVLVADPIESVAWDVGLLAFGAGLIWGVALTLMFWVLKREEVSRVTPVWQSSPIFAALLAVVFLGEVMTWQHWLAVMLVVAGAAAVSYRAGSGISFIVRPNFLFLFGGAAMIGVAQLFMKQVADDLSVWHSMALRGLGLFTSLALPSARPSSVLALARYLAVPRQGAALICTETIGPLFGNYLLLTAVANGPISLVSALSGTRPVFVFIGALVLVLVSKSLLGERLTRADIVVKAISTLAVMCGIALIAYG